MSLDQKLGARVSQCLGKSRYPTEAKAERYMRKALQARPGTPLRVYACRHCQGWHMTSKPPRAPGAVGLDAQATGKVGSDT